jgi:prepilin-type processing-associated H-X9-DG protein
MLAAEMTLHGYKWGGWCGMGSGVPMLSTVGERYFHAAFVPGCWAYPIECNNPGGPWTDPAGGAQWPFPTGGAPYAVSPTFLSGGGINSEWFGANSRHPGGVNALRADGSVHFARETMPWHLWAKLVAMSDANPVDQ